MTTDDPLRQELIDLATALATAESQVLRVAYKEESETTDAAAGAAHFLKLNERRLGRDLEQYGFMGASIMGWQGTLVLFLEEVVLPLEKAAPTSYVVACEKLKEIGKQVYPTDLQADWEELLA